jgi:hypothetical protein
MPYVARDESGKIIGVCALEQPGYAEEYLPDDDPEVVAFLAPPVPPTNPAVELAYDHENRLRALEGLPPLTMEEFAAKTGM